MMYTFSAAASAFLATRPAFAQILSTVSAEQIAKHAFVSDVLAKLNRYGSLSDRQVFAVQGAIERLSQPEEVKVPVVTGRSQTITGQVVSVKWKDSSFNRGGSYKMTVKVQAQGGIYLVWGTVPSGLGLDNLKGQHVRFVADVSAPAGESFGFFKRPRQATVIAKDPTLYGLASGRYEGLNPLQGGEEAA